MLRCTHGRYAIENIHYTSNSIAYDVHIVTEHMAFSWNFDTQRLYYYCQCLNNAHTMHIINNDDNNIAKNMIIYI